METRIRTKRVYRTEPDLAGNSVVKTGKMILNLARVGDYEEYSGTTLIEHKKPLTTVLLEYQNMSEYKVIEMDFEEVHKLMEKFNKYLESLDGIRRAN